MKRLQNELTVHTVEWIQWEVSPDKSYTLRAHSACHRNHFRGIVITRSSNRNDKNDNVCFVWGFKHILKEDLCASQWKVRWKLRACWHKRKRKKITEWVKYDVKEWNSRQELEAKNYFVRHFERKPTNFAISYTICFLTLQYTLLEQLKGYATVSVVHGIRRMWNCQEIARRTIRKYTCKCFFSLDLCKNHTNYSRERERERE